VAIKTSSLGIAIAIAIAIAQPAAAQPA